MQRVHAHFLVSLAVTFACGCTAVHAPSTPRVQRTERVAPVSDSADLAAEIRRIASLVDGPVGVAAVHVGTGERFGLRAGERFPMASTYKIAIAATLLERVQRGDARLDELVPIRPQDLRPGSELSLLFAHPGVELSLANLIDLSLSISDNTAADRVLARCGGPAAVNAWLHAHAIEGLRVDLSTLQSLLVFAGADGAFTDDEFTFERWRAAETRALPAGVEDPMLAAGRDVRNSTTPDAMADLLTLIARGEALDESGTQFLLRAMIRSSGSTRIRGLLPATIARPAHKTGTITGATRNVVNDVGIVELPEGRGQLALAIYVGPARGDVAALEAVIAQLARALVDAWTNAGAALTATRNESDPSPPRPRNL